MGVYPLLRSIGLKKTFQNFFEARHNICELRWLIIEEVYCNAKAQVNLCLLHRETYWIVSTGLNEEL